MAAKGLLIKPPNNSAGISRIDFMDPQSRLSVPGCTGSRLFRFMKGDGAV